MNKTNSSDIFPFLNQEDIDKAVSELDQPSVQNTVPIDATAENVQKQVPVIDNKAVQNTPPVVDNSSKPNTGNDNSENTKLSRSQEIIKLYRELQGTSPAELSEAKRRDTMLNLVGSLGDNLTTYLNASGEKNAMTGAGVLAGKSGAEFASKLATNAQEALAKNKLKQEALLKEYQEMSKGERQAATLEANKLKAEQDRLLDERRVRAYENQVANSGKNNSGRNESGFTPYQQYQTEQKEKENVRKLSESVTKSGIPRLMEGVGKLEETIGMPIEEAVARNNDKDKTNDVDLPGYGRLTSILPDQALVTGNGRDIRQQVAGILNPEISEQYGATQALGEVKRFEKQSGTGGLESVDTVLKGLLGIKKAAQADLKNIKAGYEPNIQTKYQERGGLPASESKTNKFPMTLKKDGQVTTVENEQELKEAQAENWK